MFKKLYIAEKPSLARAIVEALVEMSIRPGNEKGDKVEVIRGDKGPTHMIVGGSIAVAPYFGHMLEQEYPAAYNPEFGGSFTKSAHLLPCIPDVWQLKPIAKSASQLKVVEGLYRKSEIIVNAGDPDPEGMLLIQETIEYFGNTKPVLRMLPNAMDMATIKKAIIGEEDNNLHMATYHRALGRSRSDWLVGINMSRACTCANVMGDTLTVGRVQTPTLTLIVNRDLEIENFVPSTYFNPTPTFAHANGNYVGKWMCAKDHPALNKDGKLADEVVAKKILSDVDGKEGSIKDYSVTDRAQKQPLPFSLSAIQSKANTAFGLTAEKVLKICQSLYETHKVASYPRTDSGYLKESQFSEAPGVLAAVRSLDPAIAALVDGADTSIRSSAWDDSEVIAHHGIIPTSAPNYGSLSPDEMKVFTLIVKQYIAQFYPPYTYKQTTVVTSCGGHEFKSNGRTPMDPGWRKVLGTASDDENVSAKKKAEKEGEEDQDLPPMENSDRVKCTKSSLGQSLTKAPRRFTEASLLYAMTHVSEHVDDPAMKKRLETGKGIGTPATQANTIERLKEVGYIVSKGRELISVPGAREYIRVLPVEVTDPALTARWDLGLDRVQDGSIDLASYMKSIETWVTQITKRALATKISIALDKKAPGAQLQAAGAGSVCPKCEIGTMTPRKAKSGANAGAYFLGCSNYPDCKFAQNVPDQKVPAQSAGGKKKTASSTTKGKSGSGSKKPRASSTED